MSSRLMPGFKQVSSGVSLSLPQARPTPAPAEDHGHGQRGQGGRAWIVCGCGRLSGGAGAGFHSPCYLCHGLPGVDSSGGGASRGDRQGHGPAPLCCPPGGKILRDRAGLGVGSSLNMMRSSSFHLDQTGRGLDQIGPGRGCWVHCLLPAAPSDPVGSPHNHATASRAPAHGIQESETPANRSACDTQRGLQASQALLSTPAP